MKRLRNARRQRSAKKPGATPAPSLPTRGARPSVTVSRAAAAAAANRLIPNHLSPSCGVVRFLPLLVLFPCCGGQKHLSRRRPLWPAGNGKTGKNSGDDDDMIGFASLRPTATDPQISIIPPLALAPILLLTREGPKHQGTAKRRRSRAASYFPREINYTGYFLEWRRRLPSLARSVGRSVAGTGLRA